MNLHPGSKTLRGLDRYLKSFGTDIRRYGNASHAFKDVLLYLSRKSGIERPNVIMPGFIPAKLYRTVVAAGYEPRFYDIGKGCAFDLSEVEDLIDDQTTSIFAIHYFGHPADVESLSAVAARNHISLIEDCAHVLIGSINGKALGSFGDFSIFSTRKMLQLSDGGVLVMNRKCPDLRATYGKRVRSIYTLSNLLSSRSKRVYMQITGGNDVLHVTRPSQVGWLDPDRPLRLDVRRMSLLTAVYEWGVDIQKVSDIRRDNYARLLARLRMFSFLDPVYDDLPVSWTPYSLPMTTGEVDRTLLQVELLRRGISCGLGWPESPFDDRLTKTRSLARSVIEFPTHPLMASRQFEKIVDACASYENSGSFRKKGNTCANSPEATSLSAAGRQSAHHDSHEHPSNKKAVAATEARL